jgi:hypothetical protein
MLNRIIILTGFVALFAMPAALSQSMVADSSFVYKTGEGTTITLGKGDGTKINILTTTQAGIEVDQFDSSSIKSNSSRMSLNLFRIVLSATTFKNKVTMGIVTDFTGTTPLLEAWMGYAFSRHAKIIFGQKQAHTNNRLAMADERYAQVMSQTISGTSANGIAYGGLMHNFVSSTREGGLFLETNFTLGKMRIYPSLSLTTGDGQNFFTVQNSIGYKYGGRLDIMPMGDFVKNNAYIAHDLYREPRPKLAVGVAASVNMDASNRDGSGYPEISGIYNKEGKADFANYRKLAADFIFKYKGFALVGEYMVGTVGGTDLFTNTAGTNKMTEEVASAYYRLGNAFNIQSSYVFKSGWAIDGRYSLVRPEFDTATSLVHQQNWLTVGVHKFMKNNALKIGINSSIVEDQMSAISTKQWVTNLAVQLLL